MKGSIKNKVLFALSLLFGLLFTNGGLDKFLHYMPVPQDMPAEMMKAFGAFMEIGWLIPLVGAAELIGGLLFIFPKTRALGALVIFPVMVGIILTAIVQNPSTLPIVIFLSGILIWVMYENRDTYMALINKVD